MATDFLGHEIMPGDAVVYLTYAGASAELEGVSLENATRIPP